MTAETAAAAIPEALAHFAALNDRLTATRSKLEKRALLTAYLQTLSVPDAGRAALFLAGTPFAEIDGRQLQVGGATLSKALVQLAGASEAALGQAYRRHGDLGDAAHDLLRDFHPEPAPPALTLADVETGFAALAEARGNASKLHAVLSLLARATPGEARYLVKLMTGDMRTGVKAAQVEEAIAHAYGAPLAEVRRANMLLGSLGEVVRMAGAATLAQAEMRLFHPLGFMLASPVDSVDEALERFQEELVLEAEGEGAALSPLAGEDAAPRKKRRKKRGAEPDGDAGTLAPGPAAVEVAIRAQMEDKFDGIRAQLHCGDPTQPGRVGLFSRNREDLAGSFPELIEAFARFGEPVILDGEILAWQPRPAGDDTLDEAARSLAGGRALPFSSLQQRLGRKRVTAEIRESIPVIFMAFDVLFSGGALLLEAPLAERRAVLEALAAQHTALTSIDGAAFHPAHDEAQTGLFADAASTPPPSAFPRLLLSPATPLSSAEQLDRAYTEARERGNEGVMLKAAGSLYQPGRRGYAWLKLKRTLPTLDVVITGAEYGTGRRSQHLSDYTFAVRGPDGAFQNVGKAYSGVTDAEMESLSRTLAEQTVEDFGHFRTVEPSVILEVAFNNVTRSARHSSGFALRFPRILRIRDDKPLAEIDTLERVEEIYNEQPDKPVEPAAR
jgi:DNA ligase 1